MESGRPEDRVVLLRLAVGEVHRLPFDARDAGSHRDAAVLDPVQEELVDHRATLREGAVSRFRQTRVVLPLADRDAREQPRDEVLLVGSELRHPGDLLPRHTEVRLRLEVHAFPHDDVDVQPMLRGVGRQIASGVAGAHDQHTRAVDVARVAVRAGVDLLSREVLADRGPLLIPQVPVGDEDAVVVDALPGAEKHRPPVAADRTGTRSRSHRDHLGLEADDVVQPVRPRVRLEILAHLVSTGEMRIVRGHGESLEPRHVAGRDQVQSVVVGVPMPAHTIGLLEAVDVHPLRAQSLKGGDAGGAGTDDAVAGHFRVLSSDGFPSNNGEKIRVLDRDAGVVDGPLDPGQARHA